MDVCLSNSKEKCADWGTAFKQPVESTLLGRIQGGCEVEPLRTCFEPALLPSSLPPWPLPVPPGGGTQCLSPSAPPKLLQRRFNSMARGRKAINACNPTILIF
eukprot:scaffold100568_cov21-Tisochrysis_lutea.AAC.1